MALTKTFYRIILSSPSDLMAERRVVKEVVDEINETYKSKPFGLQLIFWEEDVSPELTLSEGQIIIDKAFQYEKSDLIVGLFYKKLGTPTLNSESGTVHEIEQSIENYKLKKSPEIKLYFKNVRINLADTSSNERAEYETLENKKREYMNLGIIQKFDDSVEFERLCRKHILQFFDDKIALYNKRHSYCEHIIMKNRKHFDRMEEIVSEAKHDILILGINLEGALNISSLLLEMADKGVHIRLLALNPFGEAINHFNTNDIDLNYRKKKIISNLEILTSRINNHINCKLHIVDKIFGVCSLIDRQSHSLKTFEYLFNI